MDYQFSTVKEVGYCYFDKPHLSLFARLPASYQQCHLAWTPVFDTCVLNAQHYCPIWRCLSESSHAQVQYVWEYSVISCTWPWINVPLMCNYCIKQFMSKLNRPDGEFMHCTGAVCNCISTSATLMGQYNWPICSWDWSATYLRQPVNQVTRYVGIQ